jgi:hypothetical protein
MNLSDPNVRLLVGSLLAVLVAVLDGAALVFLHHNVFGQTGDAVLLTAGLATLGVHAALTVTP